MTTMSSPLARRKSVARKAGAVAVAGAVAKALTTAAKTGSAKKKSGAARPKRSKLPIAMLGMAIALLVWRELPAIKRYYNMTRM
ncbi:hypothetical protein [uncultured Thermomonospora sp.]|nr:hypothetical protein [uncultured Thermomonospora sp.]